MKSRVLTLAIISAIIQHLKYLHDLATATPFLQPLQHSFCIQFGISVFGECVILSTSRLARDFCLLSYRSSAYKGCLRSKAMILIALKQFY